ncbi:hypothetical protein H9Q08_19800 [Chryseobacterium sp. PS-8]|uniref:Outer membrane protein beta-barrel domain-containing protein n=1 Tax=Chryseobacterium indicum TaxID=2766954 RepID=A0ABS9CBG4_9FLAO|nr:hypothetical protein [Chryseobacterium sp. PS-8]MCF2221514.1 hypothetical protein [Chryseobacterium sp. PS-8]
MKTKFYFFIVISMIAFNIKAQELEHSNTPNGLRVKKGEKNYFHIYKNNNFKIDTTNYRRLDPSVYFEVPKQNKEIKFNKKTYILIAVPGYRNQSEKENTNGSRINNLDYDKEFWTEKENIFIEDKNGHEDLNENNVERNYSKFSNDFFSGLLTAPFKYRFGGSNESLIDGDFNVAPFLGWKFRLSKTRPYFFAPFFFTGITTLKYNSTNNTKIMDLSIEENSSGFTYGGGISLRFGNISPGVIIGFDKGTGNLGSGFIYNNKPWLSFSLNYDFFKPKESSKNGN